MSSDKQPLRALLGVGRGGVRGESDTGPSAAWGAVSQSLPLTRCRSQGPT